MQQSLQILDAGTRNLQELGNGGGVVLVGGIRKLAAQTVPTLMQRFRTLPENEHIRFELHTESSFTADLLRSVQEERLDMAFVSIPGDEAVFENIAFAMRAVNTPERNINHMIPQILSLVNLSDKADSYPSQLSGGEKQRAAMARAMANNPPILIADEPTGNLDPTASAEIMHLFERFNKLGTTVLVISHAREIIDKMQKRVLELNRGRLIRDSKSSGYYA